MYKLLFISPLKQEIMKVLVPNMRVAMMLLLAFVITLLLSSCSDNTSSVVVIPRAFSTTYAKTISLEKQVWRVNSDELSLLEEGDTVVFNTTFDNNTSTDTAIIVKKAQE